MWTCYYKSKSRFSSLDADGNEAVPSFPAPENLGPVPSRDGHGVSQVVEYELAQPYQHRVDTTVPIEIVLDALREFVESGKIKWIGLSECSADTLRRARAVKGVGEKVRWSSGPSSSSWRSEVSRRRPRSLGSRSSPTARWVVDLSAGGKLTCINIFTEFSSVPIS